MFGTRFLILACAAMVGGCGAGSLKPNPGTPQPTEAKPSGKQSAAAEIAAATVSRTLPDGLTDAERDRFNHLSMGSELIPLEWLRVLHSLKTGELFLARIERFGLIPDPGDPHGLPIGLTAAPSPDLKGVGLVVGMNCAACHTGQIRYGGQTSVIIGGQALFDVTAFTGELFESMAATAKEPRELTAFVSRLWKARGEWLAGDGEPSRHRHALLAHLAAADGTVLSRIEQRVQVLIDDAHQAASSRVLNTPGEATSSEYEDFGGLLNGFDHARHAIIHESERSALLLERFSEVHAAEAVHRFSQDLYLSTQLLSGRAALAGQMMELKQRSLEQTAAGPGRVDDFNSGRNLLFPADQAAPMISPCSIPPLWGLEGVGWTDWDGNTTSALGRSLLTALAGGAAFDPRTHLSTVPVQHLLELEQLSQRIAVPAWPADLLGALDPGRIVRGRVLFAEHCARCHRPRDSAVPAPDNFPADAVFSLQELGTDPQRLRTFSVPVSGQPLAAALQQVAQQYLAKASQAADLDREAFEQMEREHPNRWRETDGYVARSLAGIWATAPYLHNGSVPTLWDLLSPPAERPAGFHLGSAEYDPEKVGYRTDQGGTFRFDTTQPGNSNVGHLYGTDLPEQEKRDLLEYLKSL
jgi:hypothetical protein